jgi:[ribosomal protein S5]-alanine N-acetyltransferase
VERASIRTEHLTLRPLPAAAARMLPGDRDGAARRIGAALATEWPQPDLLDVLPMQASSSTSSEPYGVWVIIDNTSDMVIGDVGFMGPPGEEGIIEIGYSVIPGYRGRGFATEAVRALTRWGLNQPAVISVVAHCEPGNGPSIAVLARVGFVCDDVVDGQLQWRLTRD